MVPMASNMQVAEMLKKEDQAHNWGYLVPVPLYVLPLGFSCLLDFYNVRDKIVVEMRPQLILNAEKELGIVSGLEDRVAQVYGGLVYMDFNKEIMTKYGHGNYMLTSILLALWSSEFFFPQKSKRLMIVQNPSLFVMRMELRVGRSIQLCQRRRVSWFHSSKLISQLHSFFSGFHHLRLIVAPEDVFLQGDSNIY